MAKNLILYYSRKGENYWGGKIVDLKKDNTERVAEFIQNAVGGDLFEVEPVKTYSADYHQCTQEAQAELQAGERVEPKTYLDDLTDYDTIFVGYPNWWGTMPMVLFTFLEHYDLTGKSEFTEYDDTITRRYVERITVAKPYFVSRKWFT